MTYSHLGEIFSVLRTFNAIIVFTSAETIPHCFDICRNCRCRPVGIAVICYDRTEMLKLVIFIFDRCFQPIFRIKIHNNSALVETVAAFGKIRFHDKRKEFFIGFRLKYRCIVVAEMIISSLP